MAGSLDVPVMGPEVMEPEVMGYGVMNSDHGANQPIAELNHWAKPLC